MVIDDTAESLKEALKREVSCGNPNFRLHLKLFGVYIHLQARAKGLNLSDSGLFTFLTRGCLRF